MSERAGRNDPCPCGSGSKYKKCCANKPTGYQEKCCAQFPEGGIDSAAPDWEVSGSPLAACGAPAGAGLECAHCGKRYAHCPAHHGEVMQMMRGHVLRVHPEKVPGMIEKLRRSPDQIAVVRAQFARDPENWRVLVEHVWPAS